MAAAEALVEGDAMLDSAGAEDGAEEAGADEALDPPQAVRLSMAAAAIPATANVVRLMFCISVSPLLCRCLPAANFCRCGPFPTVGHRPLVGVSMGIRPLGGNGWVRM
jgi:hypothetical protein